MTMIIYYPQLYIYIMAAGAELVFKITFKELLFRFENLLHT